MVTSDMNRAAGCELPAESLRRVTVNSGLASASEHLQHDEFGNHTPEKANQHTHWDMPNSQRDFHSPNVDYPQPYQHIPEVSNPKVSRSIPFSAG